VTTGKYDIAVSTGPSFTTRRQEAATEMTEMLRAFPQAAPFIGDLLAKNLDWPGADEIAERLKALVPGQQQQIPDEVKQAIEEGKQRIQQLEAENQKLKLDQSTKMAAIQADSMASQQAARIDAEAEIAVTNIKVEAQKQIEAFKARTQAEATIRAAAMKPAPQPARQSA
jgi:hypothetical protein